jgi:hypothetical protein
MGRGFGRGIGLILGLAFAIWHRRGWGLWAVVTNCTQGDFAQDGLRDRPGVGSDGAGHGQGESGPDLIPDSVGRTRARPSAGSGDCSNQNYASVFRRGPR